MAGSVWARWQEFAELCGNGPLHEDLRWGLLIAKLHNVNCTKREDMIQASDVFPVLKAFEPGRPAQTAEEYAREQHRIAAELFGAG